MTTRKAPAKKPATKKVATKKPASKKPATKKPATKKVAAKKPTTRADFGAPIDGYFDRQPQPQRAILDALHALVREAAPEAVGTIKWGMPFFAIDGVMMCALTAHKAHVNLVLSGPQAVFVDPDGLLAGDGKVGRHLKLRTLDELPRAAVRGWLKTAAAFARDGGS